MTKDEALVKYNEIDKRIGIRPFWEVRDIIENLCSQIEELQSRSCENCKYLDMDLICTNEDTPCCSEYSGRFDDFNCNKWEIRDENGNFTGIEMDSKYFEIAKK